MYCIKQLSEKLIQKAAKAPCEKHIIHKLMPEYEKQYIDFKIEACRRKGAAILVQ
jgi:hypothetical protein